MKSYRILVVDDDKLARWSLVETLTEHAELQVEEVGSAEAMLARAAETHYDLILLDVGLPGITGDRALEQLQPVAKGIKVIMATGNDDEETALRCLRHGAFDYVCKPFDMGAIDAVVSRALGLGQAPPAAPVEALPETDAEAALARFIGGSPPILALREQARRIARSRASTILIRGESGTGKDLLASLLHEASSRAAHPFMDINCTALPSHLLESELFGHEKGAFTDAKATKKGLLELAGEGTVLLDEIGDMEPALQAKLLRVLEERSFKRVGGVTNIPLRAGVIATTNVDLEEAVAAGRFRQDLYYRLNVIPLTVPPLRDRPGDLPLLVQHFLRRLAAELRPEMKSVSWGALSLLCRYHWPGNVRELRNVLERILVLESGTTILVDHLPAPIRQVQVEGGTAADPGQDDELLLPDGSMRLDDVEKELIRQALERSEGNLTRAGEMLGLHRDTLRYRARKHGIID